MIVHKILVGDQASKYLPFALARMAELERINPVGIFVQRYEIEGYFITVKKVVEQRYVWIISTGETYFEFETSGYPVVTDTILVAGVSHPLYKAGVIGVRVSKGVATAKLLGGTRVLNTVDTSRIHRGSQINLLDEPVQYYSATTNAKTSQNYSRMLYNAYAPVSSHTGVHFYGYHAFFQIITSHTLLGSATAHFLRDVGYDEVWEDNTDFSPLRGATVRGSADWPRRAGIQVVQDAIYGSREFAIYIDAYDQVSVFPTSAIGAATSLNNEPLQNVDSMSVKMQRIPLPAWVYSKTQRFLDWYAIHSGGTGEEAIGLYNFPEYDWRLHPDGTKLCAVVYEREPAVFNSAYYAPFATDIGTQGPGTFYPDATSFAEMNSKTMGVAALHGGALATGGTYYMNAPGLVEATVTITLTGVKPEDFTLAVTCAEIRRPTTSSYCSFVTGYSWYDIRATTYTDAVPTYDVRRGDLCVLDIECYGRLSDGKAADLYSLKNVTRSTEIRTFGGSSTYTSGALFSGMPSLVACKMETLSFVFKYRNEVTTAGSPVKKDLHFGISVYTNNRYRYTFFPTIIDTAQQTAILAKVDQNDRMVMTAELGALDLMALNDLRDWTDATLGRLREYYVRSATKAAAQTYGAYAGNPQPYANPDISSTGYKYWKTGAFEFSAPTSDMNNWYNNVIRHGLLKPYVLFDLDTPRPGWWQYMGQMTQRNELHAYTTFFTHPNGTWALYNQSFLYNKNGIHLTPIGTAGFGTGEWDTMSMEHCIFDKVHFSIWKDGVNTTLESTFRDLYNQAITNGLADQTLTDTALQQVTLTQLKATFTLGTIPDPYDATVTYAQMRLDWPPSFTTYYRELGYFSGTKNLGTGFDAHMIGGALDLSLSALWKENATDAANFIYPELQFSPGPVTFSTCVLITKV